MRSRFFVIAALIAGVVGFGCQIVSGLGRLDVDLLADASLDGASFDASSDSEVGSADADVGTTSLTLEIRSVGTAALVSIHVNGNVICEAAACVGTLAISVPIGPTSIVGVPAADNDVHFRAPSPCKGSSCTLSADAAKKAVLQVVGSNYAFVTSAKYTGDLGSLTGADAKCNVAATNAGLPGHYVAWLSDSGAAAKDRLAGARGWSRVDGLPFADALQASSFDLTKGQVFYPIALDENGERIRDGDQVFTGTRADGTILGSYACSNWTSKSATDYALVGSPLGASVSWTNLESLGACSESRHLYCLRDDRAAPVLVSAPSAPFRRAFVSATALSMTAGIDAADALCNGEASSYGETYRAYLATTAASASSRFDLNPRLGGWWRPDGVPVFADPRELIGGLPSAPVTQHIDGTYIDGQPYAHVYAWTGMDDAPDRPSAGLAFSCDDWTATTSLSGQLGHIAMLGTAFTRGRRDSCDHPWPVVCLER